jgi:hypothetical protein
MPRMERVAVIERAGTAVLFLAPVEAWVRAYRGALAGTASSAVYPVDTADGGPPRTR